MAKRAEALGQYFDQYPMQDDGSPLDELTALRREKVLTGDVESISEIFGELHFKENPSESIKDGSGDSVQVFPRDLTASGVHEHKTSPSDSDDPSTLPQSKSVSESALKNPKILQLCTEGLGSESCGDTRESDRSLESGEEKRSRYKTSSHRFSNLRSNVDGFPPPIRSIGRNGQRLVSFRSYWEDGRHVLKELRVPDQEFLEASREDGRLKLRLIQRGDSAQSEEDRRHKEDQERGTQEDDVGSEPRRTKETLIESLNE